MYRVKIFSINKTKESWLQEATSEYEKRLKSIMPIEWIFAKNNDQLRDLLSKESSFIALSPLAPQYTSEEFSIKLHQWLEKCHSRLSFLIGGSDGIPEDLLEKASHIFSLSKLTFTHQMVRLLLVEQLYRATEIHKGSNYHK